MTDRGISQQVIESSGTASVTSAEFGGEPIAVPDNVLYAGKEIFPTSYQQPISWSDLRRYFEPVFKGDTGKLIDNLELNSQILEDHLDTAYIKAYGGVAQGVVKFLNGLFLGPNPYGWDIEYNNILDIRGIDTGASNYMALRAEGLRIQTNRSGVDSYLRFDSISAFAGDEVILTRTSASGSTVLASNRNIRAVSSSMIVNRTAAEIGSYLTKGALIFDEGGTQHTSIGSTVVSASESNVVIDRTSGSGKANLIVDGGITSGDYVTVPTASNSAFMDAAGLNIIRPRDTFGNFYIDVNSGSWYSDAGTYFIRNASSTTLMQINGNGAVQKFYQPYFWARPQFTRNHSAGQRILFDVEVYDPWNRYDPANSEFNPPVAGWYVFGVSLFSLINNGGTADFFGGTNWNRMGREGAEGYYEGFNMTCIAYCGVGQTVFMNSVGGFVHTNPSLNYFAGWLLG
jgi:hypothetical protein